MQTLKIFSIIIFLSALSFSQVQEKKKLELTGNLYADSKIISNSYPELNRNPMADDLPGKKSPVLSGVLSAILPGAGQVYNEDWWIAGIFVAVEAALITTAVVYDNKGDDQTEYFENYADENWSVVQYAEYLNSKGANVEINQDESLPPWERIVSWSQLNEAEREYASPGSHTLPPHGEQQYYELIGKYHQYIPGWPGWVNTGTPPQIMLDYSQMRGQANDYYNTASTAVVGIYINHLLSAAEAVWGATRFNKNLAVNFRVEPLNTATETELVPTLKVKFSF
jgi:hypothetical protein